MLNIWLCLFSMETKLRIHRFNSTWAANTHNTTNQRVTHCRQHGWRRVPEPNLNIKNIIYTCFFVGIKQMSEVKQLSLRQLAWIHKKKWKKAEARTDMSENPATNTVTIWGMRSSGVCCDYFLFGTSLELVSSSSLPRPLQDTSGRSESIGQSHGISKWRHRIGQMMLIHSQVVLTEIQGEKKLGSRLVSTVHSGEI